MLTMTMCSMLQHAQALSESDAQRVQRAALERALADAKAKLDEANATNVRLQRESEYIIANVNRWVAEQKYAPFPTPTSSSSILYCTNEYSTGSDSTQRVRVRVHRHSDTIQFNTDFHSAMLNQWF